MYCSSPVAGRPVTPTHSLNVCACSFLLLFLQPLRQYIGRRSDVLTMSADGPLNAFVNAHGYVHETLTLKDATGLHLVGCAETVDSWFPG